MKVVHAQAHCQMLIHNQKTETILAKKGAKELHAFLSCPATQGHVYQQEFDKIVKCWSDGVVTVSMPVVVWFKVGCHPSLLSDSIDIFCQSKPIFVQIAIKPWLD